MIHHIFHRTFEAPDTRGTQLCADRKLSKAEALQYVIKAELAYGSKVTVVSPTHLKTTSGCMGSRDDMEFTGSESDMSDIVELCTAYNEIKDMPIEQGFPSQFVSVQFHTHAVEFLSAMRKGKSALSVVLNALVLGKAPQADLSKVNQIEVVELYLSLCDGSLSPKEINEVFA